MIFEVEEWRSDEADGRRVWLNSYTINFIMEQSLYNEALGIKFRGSCIGVGNDTVVRTKTPPETLVEKINALMKQSA